MENTRASFAPNPVDFYALMLTVVLLAAIALILTW
jgi:hypothetical protein